MSAEHEAIREKVYARQEKERRKYAPGTDPTYSSGTETIPSEDVLQALHRNEDGDAELFIRLHRGRIVFDHAVGAWHVWAGHHWALDTKEEALAAVLEVVDVYVTEMKRQAWRRAGAEKEGQMKEAEAAKELESLLARRIRDLQTIRRKQAVLHLARAGAESLGIGGEEWDADPWSLPVLNGVIDLRTGELRNGNPSEYFKSFAPTRWEGLNAPRPNWEAFISSIFGGNDELVSFSNRYFGYAITGKTTEAVLPIGHGNLGRNGKTVLVQTVENVMGPDLAGPIEAEMLLEIRFTRPSGGPSSDLLYLRGRRFVWLSETNENRKLNSGKVKLFTGGDLITGRAPYAVRQISFRPTHKIMLLTNHRPKADAQDAALWRRVLLIPFNEVFVTNPDPAKPNEHPADLELAEKLRAEGPGILAWLVKGCLEWQQTGLNPPESIMVATQEYKDSEDALKTFRVERCIEGPNYQVRAGLLYDAYKQWMESNGERPVTATKFGKYIGEHFDSVKDKGGKLYLGIGIYDG